MAAAEICGVKRETWSRYESGIMSPGMEVLAALAARGADVQYILTGENKKLAEPQGGYGVLTTEEKLLLEKYRTSPQTLKDAALRVLLGGQDELTKINIQGNVGQKIEGAISGGTFSVDMRKK